MMNSQFTGKRSSNDMTVFKLDLKCIRHDFFDNPFNADGIFLAQMNASFFTLFSLS